MTVFDVQEKRKEWKKTIQPDMVEHLVFLDESGVNTNLTRLYGRALSSQRAVDHAPLNTPQTTTVLSSIRLNGEKAFTTYQGGTTGERFVQYLKETLLPTLRACLKSSNKNGNEGKSKKLSRNKEFAFTIFPKPAEFVEPAKKTLYHPTARQHNKLV